MARLGRRQPFPPHIATLAAAAGGTTFTLTLSDTLAAQDAYSRTSTGNRALSDTVVMSDVFARLANGSRALSDIFAFPDAYSRTSTAKRSQSDTLALPDAYARHADALRALSDLLALADAATLARVAAGVFLIAVSDLLAATDSYARRASANRGLSDVLGAAEAFSRTATALRPLSDPLALSDDFLRHADASRSLSDLLGIADLADVIIALILTDPRRVRLRARLSTVLYADARLNTTRHAKASLTMPPYSSLEMVRGEDLVLVFDLDEGDVTGVTITFGLRLPTATTTIFTHTATIVSATRFTVPIANADTKDLDPGEYVWDCRRQPAGSKATIAAGDLGIAREVVA